MKHCIRLPTETAVFMSLEVFKTQLGKAMSNLVQPHSCPGLEQEAWPPEVPSNLSYPIMLYISGIIISVIRSKQILSWDEGLLLESLSLLFVETFIIGCSSYLSEEQILL